MTYAAALAQSAPTDSPADRTTDVVSALVSLVRSTRTIARHHHQRLGASGTPLAVLKSLAQRPDQDRPGDLAQATGVAPSVMSRVLARLEEDGLVTRHRDEADARACHIALTDGGFAQLASIEHEYTLLLREALAELPAGDVDRLPELLQSLEQALLTVSERGARAGAPTLALSLTSMLPTDLEPTNLEPTNVEPAAHGPAHDHESR
ncbi:MAG TPA: MarR family transcriptional regulator [Pedococcus sp.]|nr:MarR family transcriptional regulator [Pedococcus sp.]